MINLPWSADLTALTHGSGEAFRLVAPVTDAFLVTMVLTERDIFAPGEKKLVYLDDAENIVREEPLEVYTYHGYAEGFANSRAAVTFDSTGFLGVLQIGDLRVDYQPHAENQVVTNPSGVPMVASYDLVTEDLARAFVALHQKLTNGQVSDQAEVAQNLPEASELSDAGPGMEVVTMTTNSLDPITQMLAPLPLPANPAFLELPGVLPAETEAESDSADDSEVPGQDGPPTSSPDCLLLARFLTGDDLALLEPVCNPLVGGNVLFLGPAETGRVRPYADLAFRTAHSNYATRIANAYNAERNMWMGQVGIELSIYTLYASSNYSTSTNCDTHRGAFTAGHATLSGVDAYQLFTGINLSDCNGNAERPAISGVLATNPDSIVEAVDHSTTDSYNPGSSDHLGLVSGHEIAHNWGERDHPQNCRNWCTSFNIMASGKWYTVRDYWFTIETQERIMQATWGHLNDPIIEL